MINHVTRHFMSIATYLLLYQGLPFPSWNKLLARTKSGNSCSFGDETNGNSFGASSARCKTLWQDLKRKARVIHACYKRDEGAKFMPVRHRGNSREREIFHINHMNTAHSKLKLKLDL